MCQASGPDVDNARGSSKSLPSSREMGVDLVGWLAARARDG